MWLWWFIDSTMHFNAHPFVVPQIPCARVHQLVPNEDPGLFYAIFRTPALTGCGTVEEEID